ncbi:hypothetical protein [Actinoplanes sp. NPDC051851]|uniref:effector-associated constant component EACC1 n=1 Tax=Actinoplanes sp. NPDC051851 TaxID=3154753 RepID=UPI0034393A1B
MPFSRDSGGMIEMEISLGGDDSDHCLNDLRRWVRADDDLAAVRWRVLTTAPAPGEMSGGAATGLVATFLQPELAVALVSALGGWAAARVAARRTRIRVRIGDHEVEVEGPGSRSALERLVRDLWADPGEAA